MLQHTPVVEKRVVCMICGRPAGASICPGCVARVQGQAIEAKREAERPGRAETTRH